MDRSIGHRLLRTIVQTEQGSHPIQNLLRRLVHELGSDMGFYVRYNPDGRELVLQETYATRCLPSMAAALRDLLTKAAKSKVHAREPNPALGYAPFVAWKQLAHSETHCVLLHAKQKGRHVASSGGQRQSLASASDTKPTTEIYIPVVLDDDSGNTSLHGIVILVGGSGRQPLDLGEVQWIAALVGRSVSWALSNWRRELWNLAIKRLASLLWPSSFDEVYRRIIDSIGILNRLQPDFPVVKLTSIWSFGGDAGSGVLAKQAMHNFLVDGYNPESSRVLVGSVIGDPPSDHFLFQQVSQWVQSIADTGPEAASLNFADFASTCRVGEVESGFYDYSKFLAGNHIEERDLLALIPIMNASPLDVANSHRIRREDILKGAIVLYIDKDSPLELLREEFLAEFASSISALLERAELATIRTIRKAISDKAAILFHESAGKAKFLASTVEQIRDQFGVEGCSIYLYDASSASLVLSGSTGVYEIKSGKVGKQPISENLYTNCKYNSKRKGKNTWRFFSPHIEGRTEGSDVRAPFQDLCFRTADNYYGCRSAPGPCSKYSEITGICHSKLQTVIADSEGRGIGLLRCVNKRRGSGLLPGKHEYCIPSPEETQAFQECAQILGLLLDLREKSASAEHLLRRVGHELPTQIGLIMQNLEEIEAEIFSEQRKHGGRIIKTASHMKNLFNETGYSALIIQYFTSISTLLSLTEEQVKESKRPLRLRTFLAKSLPRLRNQARERGVYIQYSSAIEDQDPVILADRSFDLALINIMNNAIQYSGFATSSLIDWKERRDSFDLSVSDLGIPLPKGIPLQTIYSDGYRSPAARAVYNGGTGFGLTVAKHVIEKHRFQISPKCPANPVSERNVFGIQALLNCVESGGLSDISKQLGITSTEGLVSGLLTIDTHDLQCIERHSDLAIPVIPRVNIHRIPQHFLRVKADGGEDLDIISSKYLTRPLYRVTFSIRIPKSEVVR